MRDRFTRKSRSGRGNISKRTRLEVYKRDQFKCQFCGKSFKPTQLTIDHLVPLDRGGLNEETNYATCCRECNQRKANLPLAEFAESLRCNLEDLPVHGDPVLDNRELPLQIRDLRRGLYNRYRREELQLRGKQAQKKLEKQYRISFWNTDEGRALEREHLDLPGQVRVMIPEIKAIASNSREFWLLLELAKSANTRNLIGTSLTKGCDIEESLRGLILKTRNESLRKRMVQAHKRFEKLIANRKSSYAGTTGCEH